MSKAWVAVVALGMSVGGFLAYNTSSTGGLMRPDDVSLPAYRMMKYDSLHDQGYIRIGDTPGNTLTDLNNKTVTWGDTVTHQGSTIWAWNSDSNLIWVENSNQVGTQVNHYSKRLLIQSSDYLVKRGQCDTDQGDSVTYTDGDSRWHLGTGMANYRINVYKNSSNEWWLEWFDVVNCVRKKNVKLLADEDPSTTSGGELDTYGWTRVMNLGNFEGNTDYTSRYIVLNGNDPDDTGNLASNPNDLTYPYTLDNTKANEMVVIDMGTDPNTNSFVSKIDADLCTYNDFITDGNNPYGDPNDAIPCWGLGPSAGMTTMSRQGYNVIVKYAYGYDPNEAASGDTGAKYTRVWDYDPATPSLTVRDLLNGGENETTTDCACTNSGHIGNPNGDTTDFCATGKRSKGFGPLTDHGDTGTNPHDGEAYFAQQKVSQCNVNTGGSWFNQSTEVETWRVLDGTLYGNLFATSGVAGSAHVSTRSAPGKPMITWFDDSSSPYGIFAQECMVIDMSSVGSGTDDVQRFVHHHAKPVGPGTCVSNVCTTTTHACTTNDDCKGFEDEDEPQCSGREDGARQIWRSSWILDNNGGSSTPSLVTTFVGKVITGGGGGGGGGGSCELCYSCVCDE